MWIFYVWILTVIAVAAWVLICNIRTYKHRMQIIDWIYSDKTVWQFRSAQYDKVTYDQHLWQLVTFRDHKRLYDFTNCP